MKSNRHVSLPSLRGASQWINIRLGNVTVAAVVVLAGAMVSMEGASLHLIPREKVPSVFGGGLVDLELTFRNDNAATTKSDLRARIFQTSGATAVPTSETPWKTLQVLPGQTILETAALRFPVVTAETRFLVRWMDVDNRLIGITDVHVHPTNLLTRLGAIAGRDSIGVFDPANQLKPLFRRVAVPVHDLLPTAGGEFTGRLAIIGPSAESTSGLEPAAEDIRRWAKLGKACVWFRPMDRTGSLRPSFQVVRLGAGTVVVANQEMVSRLAVDPEAQLNLIHLAEYALQPARLDLVTFEPQTTPAP